MKENKRPFIIAVSGGSGSGKTSFIRDLRDRISERHLCVVSLDDYYKPKEEQKVDKEGIHNFDLPYSFREEDFMSDLERLINGEEVELREYTFNNRDKLGQRIVLKPAPVILIEGLFALHFLLPKGLCDLSVFIHAHPAHMVVRRVKRDRIERNYPLDDVLYRYVEHVNPAFQQFIAPYKEKADIIVNNNDSYLKGLAVLEAYIKALC